MKIRDNKTRRELESSVEDLFERRISRRDFLRRTAVLGVSAAFANSILMLHSKEAFAAEQPSGEVLEKIREEGGRLLIYNWEDYIDPDVLSEFEEQYGVRITYDSFPGNEALLARMQAGGVRYDLVFPTHNFVPIHTAQDLLQPLNHDLIPNIRNNTDRFLDTEFDPGNEYSLPFMWGMTGMAHNVKFTGDDPNLGSWAMMFESGPERYSGRLGFTDEMEEAMGAALAYLGYSVNSRNEQELRDAGRALLDLKPHIQAFYPGAEQTKALIQEDVVVANQWSGEVLSAHEENSDVRWMLPEEGGTAWFDTMCIPRVAPHVHTAHAFLDYMMRPDIAARNAAWSGYATPNQAALEQYVPEELAQNPAVYPTETELQRLEFLAVIPDEILPIYTDIWTRVLAS